MGNEIYYLVTIAFTVFMVMLIMAFIAGNHIVFDIRRRIRFVAIFLTIGILAITNMSSYYIENILLDSRFRILDFCLNFFGFSVTPLLPLLIARILSEKESKLKTCIEYGCLIAYVITILGLTIGNQMFLLGPNCEYTRMEAGFAVYICGYTASSLYLLIISLNLSKRMIGRKPIILFILFFALIAGSFIQILDPDLQVVYLVVAIITTIFYNYATTLWAQIDSLTGLFSQYSFLKAVERIKPGDALFIMDADNFKDVNDTYGHLVGDDTLKAIAKIVYNVFGKSGKCYRFGGDEFIVIAKKEKDFDSLKARFKEEIENKIKETPYFPNVSIGYAIRQENETIATFERLADLRMYYDKKTNKSEKQEVVNHD